MVRSPSACRSRLSSAIPVRSGQLVTAGFNADALTARTVPDMVSASRTLDRSVTAAPRALASRALGVPGGASAFHAQLHHSRIGLNRAANCSPAQVMEGV